MARRLRLVAAEPERVYVVRWKSGPRGWWVIIDGDPTDRSWRNFLSAQKLQRGFRQLAETIYSGGSGADVGELRERPNDFVSPLGRAGVALCPEVAPDDKEEQL